MTNKMVPDVRFYRNALSSLLSGICSTTHFPTDWDDMEYVQQAKRALAAAPTPAAPVAESVADWQNAASAPDCPTITENEPVRLVWRNAQGLRCTTWRSANEIGAALHPSPPVTAGLTGEEACDAARYRHRREIEVSERLSRSGVMAISPELYGIELAAYDAETDALKHEPCDFD